jgi:methyl-accepting chemotaxis protein
LKEVALQVKTASDTVATGSDEIRQTSERMSQGATQQASATEEASTSMEQMAANIRQNANNARQTEQIALQSTQYAEESGKVVAEAVVAMQQIAKKIIIIQEIADQTRMLSLNATIEAVRAQDHGKAFSVVASEVRKLSDITKSAAEEINELAGSSLDISEKAGEMLSTLVPNIQRTAELVQEISAASGEQSRMPSRLNRCPPRLKNSPDRPVNSNRRLRFFGWTTRFLKNDKKVRPTKQPLRRTLLQQVPVHPSWDRRTSRGTKRSGWLRIPNPTNIYST